MNLFAVSGLLVGVTCIAMAAWVFLANKKNSVNRLWAVFCISVAIWGFGGVAIGLADGPDQALVFWRLAYTGVILIPVLFYHFVLVFLNLHHRKALFLAYIVTLVFEIANATPLFMPSVEKMFDQFYYVAPPGILYPFFVFFFVSAVTVSHIYLWQYTRKSDIESKKTQVKWFFMATIIGFLGGVTCFLPVFGIKIYPYGNLTVPLYPVIMAYAIVRHKLMDIDVIIRRAAVFAGLFGFIYGVFAIVSIAGKEFFKGTLGWNEWWSLVPVVFIISFFLRPLEQFLVKATDKYLFQNKYDYKHMIRQFMDELKSMTLNAQDIAKSAIDFFEMSIRPETTAIFMLNHFTNKYELIAHSASTSLGTEWSFFDELKKVGKTVSLKHDINFFPSERKQLLANKVAILIPLMIRQELLGVMCLGPKKSGEEYSEDDLEVLTDLSGALAIAINNSQLFEERADAEKRAMIGTLATGINHEIGNPLNIMQVALQSFQILRKEGLLESKSKEDILNDFSNIADRCLEAARRIASITKEIAEFARPDKKLAFDKVDIEGAIKETLAVLDHEMSLNHISIEKKVECLSPWIHADRGQVRQVFFNLIRNAAQAMNKSDSKITIGVNVKNEEVQIQITDNGMGIPKKNLEKLFTPFFTTKEPGKGTGLGLSMVKLMVERNNGKIAVESNEGVGTTFTLTFKGGSKNER